MPQNPQGKCSWPFTFILEHPFFNDDKCKPILFIRCKNWFLVSCMRAKFILKMWRPSRVFNVSSNVIHRGLSQTIGKSGLVTELQPVFYKRALFPCPQLEHPAASPGNVQNTKFNRRYLTVSQGVLYCVVASDPSLICRGFRITYW